MGASTAVKHRAFREPAFEEREELRRQRIILLRHAVVFVLGDQQLEQQALRGVAGRDRGIAAVAGLEQPLERVEPVTAFLLVGTVTRRALGMQHGGDLAGKTDGVRGPSPME